MIIDTYKFLSTASINYLDKDKLKIVCSEFCKFSTEDFDLLTRKDVFSYKYVDCIEKLDERCLRIIF